MSSQTLNIVAIRFRWIWVEKKICYYASTHETPVAIRFRWIWVEKRFGDMFGMFYMESQSAFAGYGLKRWRLKLKGLQHSMSQSAFAGYGLKRHVFTIVCIWIIVAIRFRWIWVEKWTSENYAEMQHQVAIRFRWIWVEKQDY